MIFMNTFEGLIDNDYLLNNKQGSKIIREMAVLFF